MQVHELMTLDVETVAPSCDVAAARARMERSEIHHLVIVRKGMPCGVVSARDLVVVAGAPGSDARRTVADVMTPVAVTVQPTKSARQAANLMRGRGIGCLPVVDRGRVVGIVTVSDLLEFIGRGRTAPRSNGRGTRQPRLRRSQIAPRVARA